MRIVIVNHCHPTTPHVCATRAREFAHALARRGHAVLLATETREERDVPAAPEALRAAIAAHDWSTPFVVGFRPTGNALTARARKGKLGPLAGPAVLAWGYLANGTVFGDWVGGAGPFVPALAESFRPDVVWAVFGNTGAFAIGRAVAAAAGCPWVMDVKDNWARFVPQGLRRRVAARFADAAGATAFSRSHAAEVRRWFGRDADVVYSGLPGAFLATPGAPLPDRFNVVLIGAVRPADALNVFMAGFARWFRTLDDRARAGVSLDYFGADGEIVRAAARAADSRLVVGDRGFRPLDELRAAQTAAAVNVYIRSAEVPFHHKVFEMLAAGRPVLCVPGESSEAETIAAEAGLSIRAAPNPGTVESALAEFHGERRPRRDVAGLKHYTWDEQAVPLEAALRHAAGRSR